jgi:hypothetical protein
VRVCVCVCERARARVFCVLHIYFRSQVPAQLLLRPLLTGWLADPSVLTAESEGLALGSEANYCPGLSLMGGARSTACVSLSRRSFDSLFR